MALTDKVKAVQSGIDLGRIENLLKRLEKFEDIQPNETVWSEQRMLGVVRSYIGSDNDAFKAK
jgi:hypothetical protein